jgi:Na+(H+)/acetate symporter ActP
MTHKRNEIKEKIGRKKINPREFSAQNQRERETQHKINGVTHFNSTVVALFTSTTSLPFSITSFFTNQNLTSFFSLNQTSNTNKYRN